MGRVYIFVVLAILPVINAGWTPWYDRDNPSGTGDWESVSSLVKEKSSMCEQPIGIECRTVSGASYRSTNEKVTCCANSGLVCKNEEQTDDYCQDYKVRFLCPCE